MEDPKEMIEKLEEELLLKGYSQYTLKMYTFFVRKFLEWSKGEISEEKIRKFMRRLLLDENYSSNSLYLCSEALKKFLEVNGMKELADKIEAPKRPKALPKYLTEEEIGAMLSKAKERSLRDYIVLGLLAYTGMRVSELCNLNLEDLELEKRVIHIRGGKGKKDRIVILPEHFVRHLKNYVDSLEANFGPLLPSRKGGRISPRSVQRIVKKYAELAGIKKKVTPHVLRHSFATSMLNRGADIRFIQHLLGHSTLATTEIYTHVDERTLREVYDKAGPKYEEEGE